MYNLKWKKSALSELEKLPSNISSRIFKKISQLEDSSNLFSMIKRLKGEKFFSLRVGDYRTILTIEDKTIIIWKIGHRKNIYDN